MAAVAFEDIFAQRKVPVEDIGKALSAMWRSADGAAPGDAAAPEEGGSAVVRSRALTLIALAEPAEFSQMANAVNAAIAVVPARSVIVELSAATSEGIEAEVGGMCTIGGSADRGGKHFCQEQVMLRASAERVRDLPSLLVPLAVSDLPCVLYLPSAKQLGSELVSRLLPILDVLVIDTDGCDDVTDTFTRLVKFEDAEHMIVRDIAFERLRTWREAIAASYDEVAGRDARVTAVEATCADNDAQGSLLLGWIESRFEPDERPFVRLRRRVGDQDGGSAASGAVCGISIEVNDDEKRSEIRFRQVGRNVSRVRDGDQGDAELPRPLGDAITAFTNILTDPVRDAGYDLALRTVIARYAKTSG